ncbi:hypothetical protein PANDA_012271 [Ailuropoda melanoleuca]|uniref:GID complex subunit 4 homolog n=1 Tax=Ailuropoda melanoleuca TaxID=9646 RepID=D2HLB7_AILME|nr:hypothetical protein PANDA_012271 [Ailuropoda melanoleuca]
MRYMHVPEVPSDVVANWALIPQKEYPTLTTFFEGEIISKKHPFLTRKWDADEDVDRKHWGKFLAFYQYAKSFNSDDFDYEELKNGDYVFMRWKCPLCSPGPVLITACLLVVPLHAFKKRARLQAPLASCCHASRFVFGDTVWWFTDEFVAGGWQWSPSARLTVQEQFLVPDHTIKDISGASFAGFYYICFQKSAASIEGYYYHRSSEWYQSLNLTHVPEHSAPIYEFR